MRIIIIDLTTFEKLFKGKQIKGFPSLLEKKQICSRSVKNNNMFRGENMEIET